MRMHHIVIHGLLTFAVLFYFSYKRNDLRKKVIEKKMCVVIFFTTFVRNISRYNKKIARYDQKLYRSVRKIPLILVRF